MPDALGFAVGEAPAVVGILRREHSVCDRTADRDLRCAGMLDRVVDQLGQRSVQREFPLQVEPGESAEVGPDPKRSARCNGACERLERVDESELFEYMWTDIMRDTGDIVIAVSMAAFNFISIGSLRA